MGVDQGGPDPPGDPITTKEQTKHDNINLKTHKNKTETQVDFFDRISQNRFKPYDNGPYFIYVEGNDGNIGKLHPMSFEKMIFSETNTDRELITAIKVVGKNRIQIETATVKSANTLLDNQIFKIKNLRAYIPDFLIHKTGVIRHVDTELEDEEILREIRSPVQPIRMKRSVRFTIRAIQSCHTDHTTNLFCNIRQSNFTRIYTYLWYALQSATVCSSS